MVGISLAIKLNTSKFNFTKTSPDYNESNVFEKL